MRTCNDDDGEEYVWWLMNKISSPLQCGEPKMNTNQNLTLPTEFSYEKYLEKRTYLLIIESIHLKVFSY